MTVSPAFDPLGEFMGSVNNVRDIRARKQSEAAMTTRLAELQAANRELERISAATSDVVSTISHEFRTPLTSIQGFSELIMTEAQTLAEAQRFAHIINENAARLARMVDDVLDLERMQGGLLVLDPVATDLNRLVQHVLVEIGPTTTRHELEATLDPDLPLIPCDPDLITRVITNLVTNAIKYSPAGGQITVTTVCRGEGVELTVGDGGIGVPLEHREKIFSRYGRIARPEQAGIEGTGLGLPIARQILEVHSGRIWVDANSPKGSIFHVVLPAVVLRSALPCGRDDQPDSGAPSWETPQLGAPDEQAGSPLIGRGGIHSIGLVGPEVSRGD
jgi:signal transduction histidine kinase